MLDIPYVTRQALSTHLISVPREEEYDRSIRSIPEETDLVGNRSYATEHANSTGNILGIIGMVAVVTLMGFAVYFGVKYLF
jgi:hypothetical protein